MKRSAEKKARFDEVVVHLTDFLRPMMQDDKLKFPIFDPRQSLISLELGIHWIPECETFPQGVYICSDEASLELLRLAWIEKDLAAFELCRNIGAHRCGTRDALPEGVNTFVALLLSRQIHEPSRPKRNHTWTRQVCVLLLTLLAAKRANLRPTRADETKSDQGKFSGCDAAVAAIANCNYHIEYGAAKALWSSNKNSEVQIREEMEALYAAMQRAKQTDPIASVAYPGLSDDYWYQRIRDVGEENSPPT